MDIGPTDGVRGPGRIEGKKVQPSQPEPAGSTSPAGDKLEISDGARFISELISMPAVRTDRIEEVRQLIDSGKYESDERLEGAIERLLSESPELLDGGE